MCVFLFKLSHTDLLVLSNPFSVEGEIGAINKSIKRKVRLTTMTMITPFKA